MEKLFSETMCVKIATALRVEGLRGSQPLGQPRNPVNIDRARGNTSSDAARKALKQLDPEQSRGGVDRRYEIDESPKRQNWRPISLVTLLRPATFRISNLMLTTGPSSPDHRGVRAIRRVRLPHHAGQFTEVSSASRVRDA